MNALYFASCPKHLEDLLQQEIENCGGLDTAVHPSGVHFTGPAEAAYRTCLWSRVASRVFLEVAAGSASSAEDAYRMARGVPWKEHMDPAASFAVDASVGSKSYPDTPDFTALRVKDAIADYFRETTGTRPSVDPRSPDMQVHIHLERDRASLSLDLSGGALHRREYRSIGGDAPLKENAAAAMLLRSHWPSFAAEGRPLVDPMCGSGTILIEGAMIAGDIAPGLLRSRFGLFAWRQFDPGLWQSLLQEARERRDTGLPKIPPIFGFDINRASIEASGANAAAVGVREKLTLKKCPLEKLTNPLHGQTGLLVTNPPYGVRIGSTGGDMPGVIGSVLRRSFPGWTAAVLSPEENFETAAGIKADRKNALYNGPIACNLYRFRVFNPEERAEKPLSAGGQMFANRLKKNMKQLSRWRRKEGITCYRLYDADMSEYAVAVDVYEDVFGKIRAHVQEYAPPPELDRVKTAGRLKDACRAVRKELSIEREDLILKVRRRQKGTAQYDKQAETAERYEIEEGGLRFLINLKDYLDTGIFLDHRYTRALVRLLAGGGDFLNLFSYTGTATVYAAAGGASTTTSVDTSRAYLDWTGDNLLANKFRGGRHRMVREDCFQFLRGDRGRYSLILIDPPTFSNSKDRRGTFDIQRDHARLITEASRRLEARGLIIFSTNARKFSLSSEELSGLEAMEITHLTRPPDFQRPRSGHRCWIITAEEVSGRPDLAEALKGMYKP